MGMKRRNPRRKTITVTASTAVLSALSTWGRCGAQEIAKVTRMTKSAVVSTLSRLRRKGQAQRTNKMGIGVTATYAITGKGSVALRKARKELGL